MDEDCYDYDDPDFWGRVLEDVVSTDHEYADKQADADAEAYGLDN